MKLALIALLSVSIVYAFGSTLVRDVLRNDSRAALILAGIHEQDVEATIRAYYTSAIIQDAAHDTTQGTLTLDYTDLNEDGRIDVIAILDSEATCGSGGCIATIHLQDDAREFKPLEFRYAVKKIEALESITDGMHDIRINDDSENRMVWNGAQYTLE